MKKIFYTFLLISPLLFISSCEKEGCTNINATNYNPNANANDGSCLFDSDGDGIYDSDEVLGCADSLACNFNINATDDDDNLCVFQEEGYDCDGNCVDELACNFGLLEQCQYPELGYDCEGNITEYVVGMEAEGGIVFYISKDINGAFDWGLVAAKEDVAEQGFEWGCYGMNFTLPELGPDIGSGYQNTLDIVSGCSETPIAASEALAFESEGYNDWYLPSKDELIEIYNTLGNGGPNSDLSGFSYVHYWSSSQVSGSSAWAVNMRMTGDNVESKYKDSSLRVRPIRSF